jgi:hypothetical protein
MVLESDLLAVKAGAERDIQALRRQLDEAVTGGNASKAKITELEGQIAQATSTAADVERLTQELAASNSRGEALNKRLADSLRSSLLGRGLKEERVKDLNLEQLELLDGATQDLVPNGGGSRPLDRGGSGGVAPPTNYRDKIRQGVESGELQRIGKSSATS